MTKRILAVVLAVVMAMSVLCINVAAAEEVITDFAITDGTVLDKWIPLSTWEKSNWVDVLTLFATEGAILEVNYTGTNMTVIMQYNGTGDNKYPGLDGDPDNIVDNGDGTKTAVFNCAALVAELDAQTDGAQTPVHNAMFAISLDGRNWDGEATSVFHSAKLYVPASEDEPPVPPQTETVNVKEVLLENTEVAGGWQAIYNKVDDAFLDKLALPNAQVTIVVALETAPDWFQFQVRNNDWSGAEGFDINLTPVVTDEGISYTVSGAELKAAFDILDTSKKPYMLAVNNALKDAYSVVKLVLSYDEEHEVTPPPAEDDTYVDFEHTTEVRDGVGTHVTLASELKTSGIKVEFDGPAATDGEVEVVYEYPQGTTYLTSDYLDQHQLTFEPVGDVKENTKQVGKAVYTFKFTDGKDDAWWENSQLENDADFIAALKKEGAVLRIYNTDYSYNNYNSGFQYGFQDTDTWVNALAHSNYPVEGDIGAFQIIRGWFPKVYELTGYTGMVQCVYVSGADLLAAAEAAGSDLSHWSWINGCGYGDTLMLEVIVPVPQKYYTIENVGQGQIFGYVKLPDGIPADAEISLSTFGKMSGNDTMPYRAYLVDKYKNDNAKSSVLIADVSYYYADINGTFTDVQDTTGYIQFKTGYGERPDPVTIDSPEIIQLTVITGKRDSETFKFKAGDTYVEIPTDISKAIQAIDIKPDTVKVSTVKMKSPQTKAEVPGITVDTPMQIGSGAVHGIIVNGKMLPMPHRFVNGICIGCGAKKTSGTITDMKTYLYQTYGNVAKPVYTVSKDAKYVLETTGGQDFEGKTVAGGVKLESADEIVRLATSWVGGGEVYNALIDALNANPDSVIKLTYTGTIKNFGVQSESAKTLYADFEVAQGEEYNTLTVSVADFLEATKAAIEDTGWRNVFVEPDGDVVLYGFEIVDA